MAWRSVKTVSSLVASRHEALVLAECPSRRPGAGGTPGRRHRAHAVQVLGTVQICFGSQGPPLSGAQACPPWHGQPSQLPAANVHPWSVTSAALWALGGVWGAGRAAGHTFGGSFTRIQKHKHKMRQEKAEMRKQDYTRTKPINFTNSRKMTLIPDASRYIFLHLTMTFLITSCDSIRNLTAQKGNSM